MRHMNKFGVLVAFLALAQTHFAYAGTTKDSVYQKNCAACHDSGALGAPRLGIAKDWTHRLAQGKAVLVQHVLEGFNAMPAKGGNTSLTPDDIAGAVDYLLAALKEEGRKKPSEEHEYFLHEALGKPYNHPLDKNGYFQPPSDESIPNDKFGEEVRLGKLIFTKTTQYASRYAGRALNCSNCHLNAGRKANAMPMWGAGGMFPAYRLRSDRNDNLADRIQACFRYSMNGIAPAHDAPEMRALLTYIHFLSRGVPMGVDLPGRGLPDTIKDTGFEASPSRGKIAFEKNCAMCHGHDGAGQKSADGYSVPPLWGWNSYNKGAGLYKNQKLARFIQANMPLGSDFSLTTQEALDIASYVNMHERPKDPNKGVLSVILGK